MVEQKDVFIVCNNLDELGGLNAWAHFVGAQLTARGHRVHLVGITQADVGRRQNFGSDFPYELTVLHEETPTRPWVPDSLLSRADLPARRREHRRRQAFDQAVEKLSVLFRAARPGGIVIVAQIWAMEWVIQADTAGLRTIGMSHESYRATRTSSRYERVRRYYADVDRMLALTQKDADLWARAGMGNAGFMPNPLNVTPRTYAPLVEPVVVSLGRLAYEKGQDMLLEVWSQVVPDHPGWTLRLYGAGVEDANLRAQAAALGLAGSVEFAGSTVALEQALVPTSVFALTSRAEGFPMSIMEAMAYGVPCVAFDCAPGIRELITDGVDGFIVPAGNTVEFGAALNRLMTDGDLRRKFGLCARESVQRFSPDVVIDQWECLFDLVNR